VHEVRAVLHERPVQVGDVHDGAGGRLLVVEEREQVEHGTSHERGETRPMDWRREPLRWCAHADESSGDARAWCRCSDENGEAVYAGGLR
jgi:hypothetical protein